MKIVIIQGAFLPVPPLLGGAIEKRWFILAKAFIKHGHEIIYISRRYEGLPNIATVEGIQHIRVKGFSIPKSGFILKIYDLIYSYRACKQVPRNADVIITNTFWSPLLLSKSLLSKVFVDVARIPKGQMKFYTKANALRANSTVVSRLIKAEISGKHHQKVKMVPNPLPFVVQEHIDLDKKERKILYTGRIHPEKGLEILIEAFTSLDTDWELEIIGPWQIESGGGGIAYLRQLEELSKNHHITFVGPVFDIGELNDYYRKASIFVYPSIAEKGETFGLAPLEAMAWGCVPIVSDLDCFKDFIIHQQNGVIFNHRTVEAANELKRLVQALQNDGDRRRKIACNALRVQESHSIENIAKQFLNIFSASSLSSDEKRV